MRRPASPNDCMPNPVTLYPSWAGEKIDFRHSSGVRSSEIQFAKWRGEAMADRVV